MFYEPAPTGKDPHGLPHDPFKALVAPRPIGWIGTRGADGSRNLAPYSFFNIVSEVPKIVMFSSSGRKDSLKNAEDTGVFTASLASFGLLEKMNASSIAAPYGTDEFALAGLTPVEGRLVAAPYVGEAYAALECRVTEIICPKTVDGGASQSFMVLGQVMGVHISPDIVRDGRIDMSVARPLGRLGYFDYSQSGEVFSLRRPPQER